MRRVIMVSLNGNAFQLEDDAHAVLAAYLEHAGQALAGNPDRAEILADVEQAIGDKCARYLTPHKTVLLRQEIETVLEEMGPVDGDPVAPADATRGPGPGPGPAAAAAAGAAGHEQAPRRLYQISEGALLSGVCNGLAAYFQIDVTIVRLVFVLLLFLTGGAVLLLYLVLMFVVPYAQTSEEHAAARGVPFNARTLVERAKRSASDFANKDEWRRSREEWRSEWRRTRAEWRQEWRRARAEWRAHRRGWYPPPAAPAAAPRTPYAAHVLTGLLLALLGLVRFVLMIAWIVALVSLVTTGAILGWVLPFDVPFWLAIVLLVVAYELVAWPFKALRHALYYPGQHYAGPWVSVWDGALGLVVLAVVCWLAYHHVGEFRDFIDHVQQHWGHSVTT
jgi:phage shock protein PspC (stress-responsive transcriptional regulator)